MTQFFPAVLLWVLVCGRGATAVNDQSPEGATITSGVIWNDDAGNPVHAHGLGMILPTAHPAGAGGKYYMVGTTKKHNPHWLSSGVNMYSSTDLQNWHFEAEIFRNTSITTPLSEGTQYRIERPKVIWNAKTKLYVMYFHLDSPAFRMGMVGVATSESIAGVYKYVHGFQPDGQRSLDMGLWQEEDGTAYLVRSVDNKYAGFSQLSADYLNTTGIVSRGPKCEGQAVWREGDTYYLLGSHLTGWSSNPAILATAQAPLKGATWTVLGNPSGSRTTFNSQSTYVLPYTHPSTGKQLLIYMGDRWNAGHPPNEYIWLPMLKSGTDVGANSQSNSWVQNNGLNCYANHGALDLESPKGSSCGLLSLVDCQAKCQATEGCDGVTVLADESSHSAPDGTHVLADASGKFQCYRRGNFTLPSCDTGGSYITYVAGQWAHAAGVNCYSGKGATDLESPPGSNCGTMSLDACQAKCQATEGCDGITVQPAAGGLLKCFRRGLTDLAACSHDKHYESYKFCCSKEPSGFHMAPLDGNGNGKWAVAEY